MFHCNHINLYIVITCLLLVHYEVLQPCFYRMFNNAGLLKTTHRAEGAVMSIIFANDNLIFSQKIQRSKKYTWIWTFKKTAITFSAIYNDGAICEHFLTSSYFPIKQFTGDNSVTITLRTCHLPSIMLQNGLGFISNPFDKALNVEVVDVVT